MSRLKMMSVLMTLLKLSRTFVMFLSTVFLFIVGCTNTPQEQTVMESEIEKSINDSISNSEASSSVPDDVTQALFDSSSYRNGTSNTPSISQRFDVSVNRVPARTFFLSLVADSGVNVVAHPEVSGTITMELSNVTVQEVLDVTREVYGYEFKLKKGIYSIYPRKIRTEIFPINYLDIQRSGVTDTSVLIGQINSQGSANNRGSGNQSESESDSTDGSRNTAQSSSGTRVVTKTKTNFWEGLHQSLYAIVGGESDGRMVMTNPQSGLVIVKAMPSELRSVREFLSKSELSVQRQVVLETKILEVRLNDRYEAGINWGAISGELALGQTISGVGSIGDVLRRPSNSDVSYSSSFAVADITKLLKLLETQGSVQVLSSPRISTVNNQKAIIKVGSDEFFVTGLSNQTTSNSSATTSVPEIELDSFFSGIALDVTPQIAEDGDVILHVHPVVSDVQDQIKEINIANEKFTLPLALRDIRESDSIVRAKNGEVVVLGGLMQEVAIDVNKKRPGVGDVPGVNVLFKSKEKSTIKTELVILMRPIVVTDGVWGDQLKQNADRIKLISDYYRSF